ncbi:extracellular solute-binding protein [Paenibacillus rhizovicinus]|uniref:Extracellular solute-binding protein n=1 Tax=Paenibacillus rhizovicinus TaxID=2704463 RepID=A0A6C0NUG0_9BACL|nr:extracellular solute-binding protein [Paenibacillus rhizovicinus]QHW29817.1 extracellular solute-binding protein [Paenibacillus rhizovicinus]
MDNSNGIVQLRIDIYEDWQLEAVEKAARRFEEAHDGVRVEVRLLPDREIREGLQDGTSGSDLVQLANGDFVDCSRNGRLLDLTAWAHTHQLELLFHPALWRLLQVDGRLAGLPISATVKSIFYNKEWFRSAGIPDPADGWTWQDFIATAQWLQTANACEGQDRFAARLSFDWEYIGLLLLSSGTSWLSPEGSKASGYANSEAAVKTVKMAAALVREHKLSPATQDWFTHGDLTEGKTGMILDYMIMLHEIEPILGRRLGIASLPRDPATERTNEPWISGFGIASGSAEPALAFQLLTELTCSSNELTRLVTDGFIAPLKSVYEEAGHHRHPLRERVLAELAFAGPLPHSASSEAVRLLREHANPALARILHDGADVSAALDELAEKLDRGLAFSIDRSKRTSVPK